MQLYDARMYLIPKMMSYWHERIEFHKVTFEDQDKQHTYAHTFKKYIHTQTHSCTAAARPVGVVEGRKTRNTFNTTILN